MKPSITKRVLVWFLDPVNRASLAGPLLTVFALLTQLSPAWLQEIMLEIAFVTGVIIWLSHRHIVRLTEARLKADLAEIYAKDEQLKEARRQKNALFESLRPKAEAHMAQQASLRDYYAPTIAALNGQLAAHGLPLAATITVTVPFESGKDVNATVQEPRLLIGPALAEFNDATVNQLREAVARMQAGQRAFADLPLAQQEALLAQSAIAPPDDRVTRH